jgi:hypothetical protein
MKATGVSVDYKNHQRYEKLEQLCRMLLEHLPDMEARLRNRFGTLPMQVKDTILENFQVEGVAPISREEFRAIATNLERILVERFEMLQNQAQVAIHSNL